MSGRTRAYAATAAGLTVLLAGVLASWARPGASPATAQTSGPQASNAHPASPFDEVSIQLAAHPDGGTITEDVTPGTAVYVRFWTRPSARVLRVEAQQANGPVTQHEIPAAPAELPRPTGLGPECETAFAALQAMVTAQSVTDADRAERSSESLGQRTPCPQLRAVAMTAYNHSRPKLPVWWRMAAGEQLHLKVTTVEPAGGHPTAWDIRLVAQTTRARWPHASEEEWLASEIVRDVVGLLWHASRPTAPPAAATVRTARRTEGGAAVVQVELALPDGGPAFMQEIPLEPSVFAPGAYQGLARAVAERLKVTPGRAAVSDGLLERLLDLRAANLARESGRVAAWLTGDPLDSAGNGEAALVHTALALREAAGHFTDIRQSLARATAHLVVSRLAEGPESAAGRMADVGLLVLSGRQVDVLPRLQAALAEKSLTAAERAWNRALLLRTTEDWRLVRPGERLSLLERLQLYRARRASLDGLLALDMFEDHEPEPVADWAWIALDGAVTVQEGNMFATVAFPMTLAELAEVVLGKEAVAVTARDVAEQMRPDPSPGAVTWTGATASVSVLDRGLWSAFLARALVHSANAADEHLRSALGSPEEADAFAAQAKPYFEGTPWPLALEPLLRRRESNVRYRPLPCSAFARWPQRNPESLPVMSWSVYMAQCREGQTGVIPALHDWFAWPAVPGTTVGLRERKDVGFRTATPQAIQRLQPMAPYNQHLASMVLNSTGKSRDAQAIAEAMGTRKEYTLSVMKRLARAEEDPARARPILQQLCDTSADECPALGANLRETGEYPAAAKVYEHVLAKARDRVLASNEMTWLALYYVDSGRPADAERVGRAAAAVGSHLGLDTLGLVLDRMGRLSEAEKVFKAIESRYNHRQALDLFYTRAQRMDGGAVYEDAARRAMDRFFPAGLERVGLADFTGEPTHGAVVTQESRGTRQLGLTKDDVIVALDGYRIRNVLQYDVVRGLSRDPKVTLIAWSRKRGAYAAAQGTFMDRRVGYKLEDYFVAR